MTKTFDPTTAITFLVELGKGRLVLLVFPHDDYTHHATKCYYVHFLVCIVWGLDFLFPVFYLLLLLQGTIPSETYK